MFYTDAKRDVQPYHGYDKGSEYAALTLEDTPLTAQENCTSPPVNHIHLCTTSADTVSASPSELGCTCEGARVCIRGECGRPVTLEQLVQGTTKYLEIMHADYVYDQPSVDFEGWKVLTPHTQQAGIVNFCDAQYERVGLF